MDRDATDRVAIEASVDEDREPITPPAMREARQVSATPPTETQPPPPGPEPGEMGRPCGDILDKLQGADGDGALVLEVLACRSTGCDEHDQDPDLADCMLDAAGAELRDDDVWRDALELCDDSCTPETSAATRPAPRGEEAEVCVPGQEDGDGVPECDG